MVQPKGGVINIKDNLILVMKNKQANETVTTNKQVVDVEYNIYK